jgi:hypothetical protein
MDRLEQQARELLAEECDKTQETRDAAELRDMSLDAEATGWEEAIRALVKALSTRPDVGGLVERLREEAKLIRDHKPTPASAFRVVAGTQHAELLEQAADALSSIPASGDVVEALKLAHRILEKRGIWGPDIEKIRAVVAALPHQAQEGEVA